MRQLVHSLSGDNNLVPFHLLWREIVLKSEKVYQCFVQDCLKIFLLVFICLKMHWNPKNDQFLVEKIKSLHRYCPVATETTFSPKFILDAKVPNSKIYHIQVFFCNWVALNINLKSEWALLNTNIFRKYKIKGSGSS